MKKCFKCSNTKPLTDFYAHPRMADGRLGKCKECTKKDTKTRADILAKSDPSWIEIEKARARDKYKRLYTGIKPSKTARDAGLANYRGKYPEKEAATRACNNNLPPANGMHRHHWSYAKEHQLDVLIISPEEHALLHRYMTYDQQRMLYISRVNNLHLTTKDSHLKLLAHAKLYDLSFTGMKANRDILLSGISPF